MPSSHRFPSRTGAIETNEAWQYGRRFWHSMNCNYYHLWAGVAQNTYSQYETGKIELTAPVLLKLAEFYHVSVDYLLDK